MKRHIGVTIDSELFRRIERLRGGGAGHFHLALDKAGAEGICQETETKIR